jgi:hypothetical protein
MSLKRIPCVFPSKNAGDSHFFDGKTQLSPDSSIENLLLHGLTAKHRPVGRCFAVMAL